MRSQPLTPRTVVCECAGDGFRVMEFLQPAALRIPTHAHDATTMLAVLEGAVHDRIGRRDFETVGASVLIRPAWAEHSHRYGEREVRCLSVSIDPSFLSRVGSESAGADAVSAHGGTLITELRNELHIDDAVRSVAVTAAVVELLAATTVSNAGMRKAAPPWLLRVREAIREEPARIALRELADDAGVHEGHLTRAFRRYFGFSIAAYSRAVRTRIAARALLASDRPTADIALDAGFSDQSHFHRVFRRQFGATPGDWRKQRKSSAAMRGMSNTTSNPDEILIE